MNPEYCVCPLTKSICNGMKCGWWHDEAERCAIVSLVQAVDFLTSTELSPEETDSLMESIKGVEVDPDKLAEINKKFFNKPEDNIN